MSLKKNKSKQILDLSFKIKTRTGFNYRIVLRKNIKSKKILGFAGYYFKKNMLSINNKSYSILFIDFNKLKNVLCLSYTMDKNLTKLLIIGGIV